MTVRSAIGPGGSAGKRYQVALSSLPKHLQERFRASQETSVPALPTFPVARIVPAANQSAEIKRRWSILEDALGHPARSAGRAAEIDRASARHGVPVRTIQRWIKRLEDAGDDINALGRARPADAGKPRVVVTRAFDQAFIRAGHSMELLEEIGRIATQLTKAVWASPAQRAGKRTVAIEVATALARECRQRDIELPRGVYELSQYRLSQLAHFLVVDRYENDRKYFDDTKPRIRRDNTLFRPMQQIVMDVKPLDNIVTRPDGSTTWPKMIAFQDTGTHRLFVHFVLLNKGEGVRQEHVTEAFLAMVDDPNWGFPDQIYRDNGTEFAVFDMIRGALAMINAPGARTIINARPYSGASKPIESKFATLDRMIFSQMGGWAGGNRMNKKTQTVGKPPKPYQGSFEDFEAEVRMRLRDFESRTIESGPFKGRSPDQIYADHVSTGWRPIQVDVRALDAVFSKIEERRVDRGTVSIAGTRYRHPELPDRQPVSVALPWRRGALPLADIPGLGWARLDPEIYHLPHTISGALDSGRMQRSDSRRVRELRREAGTAPLADNLRDRIVTLPTRAAPAPLMDVLASKDAERIAIARAIDEPVAQPNEDEALARRRRQMEREIARWERSSSGAA